MGSKKSMHMIAYTLIIIGALNWGLMGFFQLNLVNVILGNIAGLERIVYALVGLAAIYSVAKHKEDCKGCGGEGMRS